MRKIFFLSLFLAVGCLLSCVSLPRSFHALRYKDQKVYLDKNHYYRVGPLSEEWKEIRDKEPGILFRHKPTKATIATEAICGAPFEDLPLKTLTKNLLIGLEEVKKEKEEVWTLSARQALHTQATATLDGVPVFLNIVVIKKNRCQFDFLGVSSTKSAPAVSEDFIRFVKGFDYP